MGAAYLGSRLAAVSTTGRSAPTRTTHGSVAVVGGFGHSAFGLRRPTASVVHKLSSVVHKVVCVGTIFVIIVTVDGVRSTLLRPERSRDGR